MFVDPTPADVADAANLCGLDYVQLSGHEPVEVVAAMPRPTFKALHVRVGEESAVATMVRADALSAHRYLLDTHSDTLPGGTGQVFNWDALRAIGTSCFVAGGLRADNVAIALETLAPCGVDVSSGVEFPGGGKDSRLIRAFVEAVREYDDHHAN